ncbi:PAS domain S-box protein [bacterium]|nr:PAS domain S-box protein [bacterium]
MKEEYESEGKAAESVSFSPEAWFKLLVERALSGVYIIQEREVVYVNPQMGEILGYTPEELIGTDPIRHVHEEHRECMAELHEMRLSNFGPGERLEIKVVTSSGEARWVELHSVSAKIAGKRTVLGNMRDITDRKKAAEYALEHQVMMQLITENMADVLWVMDPESRRFRYVSPSVQQLRGFTQEEAMQQSLEEALTPESLERVLAIMDSLVPRLLAGEDLGRTLVEVRQPCKDGRIIDTEIYVTAYQADDDSTLIVGVTRDVTERKAQSKRFEIFSRTLDLMSEAAFWFGTDNRFTYANAAACASLGYTLDELVGMDLSVVNSNATSEQMEYVWKKLRFGIPHIAESHHTRKDGSTFPVETRSFLVHIDGKEYCYGTAIDIQDRLRARQEQADSG